MDDAGKQTCGNGQQKTQHSKPFFYVQPPSQPYPLYQQWQHNPYSHYASPAGFNLGRPCILPYQYMQYPGFVFPQAPIYPMDYRRMFEPRFNAPPWSDYSRQQQQQQQHRETACSEVQTDPSDAITKLIECLDRIRSNDLKQGAVRDRELDSGIASQSSGMFSPEEEKKNEEQSRVPPLAAHGITLGGTGLNRKSCWTGMEEDPPIDSSSFHEEHTEAEKADKPSVPFESVDSADVSAGKCVEELMLSPLTSLQETKSSRKVSKGEVLAASPKERHSDGNYQVLKLPLENVLTPPSAGAGHLPSPSTPYYYNYLSMQTTHERMSVLSPSLDELSSRDEMFSTDLDDVDFFPKRVYAGGRLPEVCGGSSRGVGHEDAAEEGEGWLLGSKRWTCACCGKRLVKAAPRSRAQTPKMYRDDAGDSEEEESRHSRGFVRKHGTRRPHPAARPTPKPWYKRAPYKEPDNPEQHEGRDVCKLERNEDQMTEMDGSELQCRTCRDGHCQEERVPSDQGRWTDDDETISRRSAAPSQRRDTSAQWKVIYHRPRDDDDEPPPIHWERGSTMRGEPR